MSSQVIPLPTVPFLDLSAMHAQVAGSLDRAWHEVVASSAFIGGPHVERFEREWADYCDTAHGVGVANGTDALTLVLRGLGIGHGDEVIVPANTFVATAEAVALAGAVPRFVDVDPATLLLTAEHVAAALNPRTAAVIAVHLYGQMADMPALLEVADAAGVAVIEDAAQAHGATWKGRRAGSLGRAGCFSFYPGKNLGAFGDAGAVVTNDRGLADRIRSMGNHGRAAGAHHGHAVVGTNSRLDGLQAAVLSAKLPRLDAWNDARRAAVAAYRDRLDPDGAELVTVARDATPVHHLAVVRVRDRDRVREVLARRGIQTGLHYPVPCHDHDAFRRFADGRLPVVEQAAAEVLSLPLFPDLTRDQIDRVCAELACATTPERRAHAV